jgi:predicted phage tail protein
VGVVLIGVAFYLGGAALAGPTLFGTTTVSSLMFNFGLSLVMGGLLEMLSPAPKMDSSGNAASDPEASKYLGATQNTVKIGTRIPLLYGRHIAYGHYISFDVDAFDVDLKS